MKKDGISFQIFTWALGILLVLIGYLFNEVGKAGDKAQAATDATATVASDVKVIKNNTCWLMELYPNHPPCN